MGKIGKIGNPCLGYRGAGVKDEKMGLTKPIAIVDGGSLWDRHHSEHTVFRRCSAPEKKRAVRTGGYSRRERKKNGDDNGKDILKKELTLWKIGL
jgi:hypothetical protein